MYHLISKLRVSSLNELKSINLTFLVLFLSCLFFFLQEKGNEFVRLGRKHYADAIDCYTKAINQKALSNSENSVLYANRAHVNILLGNYRRALNDAKEAINLCPTNIKVVFLLPNSCASNILVTL